VNAAGVAQPAAVSTSGTDPGLQTLQVAESQVGVTEQPSRTNQTARGKTRRLRFVLTAVPRASMARGE
jgi:hypothetical protein